MYSVYPPGAHTTELLNPKQYFDENFKDVFPYHEPFDMEQDRSDQQKEFLKNFVGGNLTDDQFTKLATYCSPDNLSLPHDINLTDSNENPLNHSGRNAYVPEPITDEMLHLETLKRLKARLGRNDEHRHNLKYRSDKCPVNKTPISDEPSDLIPGKELLFSIRLYRPFMTNDPYNRKVQFGASKLHHDLIVLGSQTLDIFRDKILCPNDLSLRHDMSNCPDSDVYVTAKHVYRSGFLFIEDTFYNDCREETNIDYSECIRNWAKPKGLGPFKTAKLENTKFEDLTIRLGYPQVYQHQGLCEHIFVFSDVRLLQPTDICHRSHYPFSSSMSSSNSNYCLMCAKYTGRWIVTDSDRVTFNPAYYCDTCFKQYNYIDGKKVGDFKAYPYFNRCNT